MKRTVILIILCIGLLSGCGGQIPLSNIPSGSKTPSVDTTDSTPPATGNIQVSQKETGDTSGSIAASQPPVGEVIEIKEKMFVAQINDIYFNTEDYLGKIIRYEGIFRVYELPETGEKFYSVIRYGPGCCGTDANAGFEVRWNDAYPKQNDWVEAVGVLEEYEYEGMKYLRLSLHSLTVLEKRGAEYVSQ